MTEHMLVPNELDRAVAAGVIDRQTADRLAAFLGKGQGRGPGAEVPDSEDEQLRLVSGFGDIFVAIGLVLFLGALFFMTMVSIAVSSIAVALASWGLAEIFTRLRKQALPSILLLLSFATMVFVAVAKLFDGTSGGAPVFGDAATIAGAGLVTCAAVALHWWRFRVPVTVAAACAGATATVLGLLETVFPGSTTGFGGLIFLPIGIAVFALAMNFDTSDRERRTRRTDIAFWLHALAAPMIVHPVMQNIMRDDAPGLGAATLTFAVFAVLGMLALTVDRRAMLVSSLVYLGYAIYSMLQAGNAVPSTAFVVLVVGAVVLGLSLAWRPLRATLLGILPAAIVNVVPPAHITSFKTG